MPNAIKYWRDRKKMTQQKLAELIEIDRPTLSKIENPNIPIDPDENLALRIARVFDILVTDVYKNTIKENEKR